MPELAVLEELGPGRTLVRVVGGPHHGEELVVVDRPGDGRLRPVSWYLEGRDPDGDVRALRGPAGRAEELLISLLDAGQRDEWVRHRSFTVPTPFGPVELGRLYHLPFRRIDGERFVLCVVPRTGTGAGARDDLLPLPDVWTNLLLMLRSDPEHFFAVANWVRPGERSWHEGNVPLGSPTPAGAG